MLCFLNFNRDGWREFQSETPTHMYSILILLIHITNYGRSQRREYKEKQRVEKKISSKTTHICHLQCKAASIFEHSHETRKKGNLKQNNDP